MLIEQGRIVLPNDEGLLGELEAFSYSLGETGKIKMGVRDGQTDDRVMSLALACWQVGERIGVGAQMDFSMYGAKMT